MLFWSCCSPPEESNKISYDIDSEVVAYSSLDAPPPPPMPSLLGAQPKEAVQSPKPTHVMNEAAAEGSVEEDTGTVQGRSCMLVSTSTGAQTEAEYIVNADLLQLEVKTVGQVGELGMTVCPVSSIEDIYTIEDGEDCFPQSIMDSLALNERARLSMIVYTIDDSSDETGYLCLVDMSESARDDLLMQLQKLSCT
mmetsp:Transcript_140010/g.355018  ORF Transcript_140010/g.355018 Transcript_140010/m.355018 type:complete len:195 (+) Transcript_140010:23-607(+)